jgi:CO/xanthine dehydrogenase Mo-binding subunit
VSSAGNGTFRLEKNASVGPLETVVIDEESASPAEPTETDTTEALIRIFTGIALRLCEDGSVIVNAGFHELGNGTLTVMTQITAEILDLPPERIVVTEGDTHFSPFDTGCIASRVTYVCGSCMSALAEKVKRRFIQQLGRLFGEMCDDIKLENGRVFIRDKNIADYGTMVVAIAHGLGEEVGDFLTYTPRANPPLMAFISRRSRWTRSRGWSR